MRRGSPGSGWPWRVAPRASGSSGAWGGSAVNGGSSMATFRGRNVAPLVCGCVVLAGFCCGRGDAAEVSVFEAVAVSFQGDDVGVVDEAVDHGGGDGVVAEDLAPAAERLVGRDDEAGSFVASGYQLEEQVGGLGFERDVADFVDDQQRVAGQPGQLGLEFPGGVGGGEPVDPLRGGGELGPG